MKRPRSSIRESALMCHPVLSIIIAIVTAAIATMMVITSIIIGQSLWRPICKYGSQGVTDAAQRG